MLGFSLRFSRLFEISSIVSLQDFSYRTKTHLFMVLNYYKDKKIQLLIKTYQRSHFRFVTTIKNNLTFELIRDCCKRKRKIYEVLAARKTILITARARKIKRSARKCSPGPFDTPHNGHSSKNSTEVITF